MWIGSLSLRQGRGDHNVTIIRGSSSTKSNRVSGEDVVVVGVDVETTSVLWQKNAWSENTLLVYGQCYSEYCNAEDVGKGNTIGLDMSKRRNTNRQVQTEQVQSLSLCANHREGLLCGKCQPGYSTTLYYKVGLNLTI